MEALALDRAPLVSRPATGPNQLVPATKPVGEVEEIGGLGVKPPRKFQRPCPLNFRERPYFIVDDRMMR